MGRVNVFLKNELLQAVDAEAREARINRSALIQAALTRYLEARHTEREDDEKRREMEDACRGMDALAEKLGNWDPVRVIRNFRESRGLQVAEPSKLYRPKSRKKRA